MVSITLCSLKEPETLIDEWMTLLPPQPELSTTLKCFFILFIFNLWCYILNILLQIYTATQFLAVHSALCMMSHRVNIPNMAVVVARGNQSE